MTNQEKHDLSKIKRKELLDRVIPTELKREIRKLVHRFTVNVHLREAKDYDRIVEIDKYLSDNNVIIPEVRTIAKTVQGERKRIKVKGGDCAAYSNKFMEDQMAKGYEFRTYNSSSREI